MGEEGVTKALQILHKELDITMAFCGHTDIRTVDQRILRAGTYPVPSVAPAVEPAAARRGPAPLPAAA
jgi:isopentenyl diphosphate isomerase/L-lactate dehydrogenase-like FMN-dependent dehydrogenase